MHLKKAGGLASEEVRSRWLTDIIRKGPIFPSPTSLSSTVLASFSDCVSPGADTDVQWKLQNLLSQICSRKNEFIM